MKTTCVLTVVKLYLRCVKLHDSNSYEVMHFQHVLYDEQLKLSECCCSLICRFNEHDCILIVCSMNIITCWLYVQWIWLHMCTHKACIQ